MDETKGGWDRRRPGSHTEPPSFCGLRSQGGSWVACGHVGAMLGGLVSTGTLVVRQRSAASWKSLQRIPQWRGVGDGEEGIK